MLIKIQTFAITVHLHVFSVSIVQIAQIALSFTLLPSTIRVFLSVVMAFTKDRQAILLMVVALLVDFNVNNAMLMDVLYAIMDSI